MARPLRRALINLSIRLGISVTEIERWSTQTIREYIAVLHEQTSKKQRDSEPQSEAEMIAALGFMKSPG